MKSGSEREREEHRGRSKVVGVEVAQAEVLTGGGMRGACTQRHLAYEVRDWWPPGCSCDLRR